MRNRKPAYRPETCHICFKPLVQARTGRVRRYCSDRCRQIKRRRNYQTWITPQREQKAWRRAEREVRKLEKALGGPGSLDIPVIPGDTYFTLRMRVKIHLQRGEEIPMCRVCGKPYIRDWRTNYPTCKGKCARTWGEQQRALRDGLERYRGQYDPRVDVRLRLKLPVRACQHCGKPFCVYGGPRQIYCSKRCNNNAWYARHPKHTCVVCKTGFRGKGKTCSTTCRRRAAAQRRRDKRRAASCQLPVSSHRQRTRRERH